MRYIPFAAFARLIFIIIKFGGLSVSGLVHLVPWLIKTILFEPLRLLELAVYERKIKCHQLTADPVFILGHYRSGTTFLYRLIIQCRGFGYMTLMQSVAPELMLLWEKSLTPVLAMFSRLFRMKNQFHRLPLLWNFPGEDDVGVTGMVTSLGSQWGMLFPEKFRHQFEKTVLFANPDDADKRSWLKEYVYLVKKISIAAKGRQLVLKSPPNTARIEVLLEAFPNAKFIYIYRNPAHVYTSSSQFWDTILNDYVLGRKGKFNKHETILWQYEKMISAYLDQMHLVPAGRLKEVAYEDLIADPAGTVKKVFEDLQLPGFEANKAAIERFCQTERSYRKLEHNSPILLLDEIIDRWRMYFNHWGYKIPETNMHEKAITGEVPAIR